MKKIKFNFKGSLCTQQWQRTLKWFLFTITYAGILKGNKIAITKTNKNIQKQTKLFMSNICKNNHFYKHTIFKNVLILLLTLFDVTIHILQWMCIVFANVRVDAKKCAIRIYYNAVVKCYEFLHSTLEPKQNTRTHIILMNWYMYYVCVCIKTLTHVHKGYVLFKRTTLITTV